MSKPAFQIEIETKFDAAKTAALLETSGGGAQKKLDAQVLNDSNYFCPMKTGTLQKSAVIYTRIGSGEVVWKTPYARGQYYGENLIHPHAPNPNACAKWFETAKARHMDDWKRLVENEIKRD